MNFLRLALLAAALTFPSLASAANRFAVCTSICTWDGVSTAMWSATTGGAPGASVPGSADAVILDTATCVGGVTCTITVNTAASVLSLAMGTCTASTTGCILDFSANNNNFTASSSFSISGTGTRTLNMGSGTFTLNSTSTGTLWTAATTTNLTLSAGLSSIVFSGNATGGLTFSGGGLTYAGLTITGGSNKPQLIITGTNTFGTLTANGGASSIVIPAGATTTITTLALSGASGSAPVGLVSSSSSAAATLSSGSTPTLAWMGFRLVTFAGAGTFAATNSFDLGGNSNITITGPSAGGGGGGRVIGG